MATVRQVLDENDARIAVIAERMRATLLEVVGEAGGSMYSPAWLRDRVLQHLDGREHGAVFAWEEQGVMLGHCIVRTLYAERGYTVLAQSEDMVRLYRAGVPPSIMPGNLER